MTQVILGENEGIESGLRRFKRKVSQAGIFPDMKKIAILKRLLKNASAKPLLGESNGEDMCAVDSNSSRCIRSTVLINVSYKPMKTAELISRYRAGQRDFRNLNLIAANLRNMNLSGANLSGANLTKANLTNTNLSQANLSDAILTGANLTETNLIRANLTNANLIQVDLSHADLRGAILRNVLK